MNLLLQTDSYKISHDSLYKQNLEFMYSHFISRGGEFDKIPFFGLQYYLKKYLVGEVITTDKIEEYIKLCDDHLGFWSKKWDDLYHKHKGILPIKIKAVPEGTVVEKNNVLFTVENTDPEFAFLTSYLETLLVKLWFPCTVAAQSYYIKNIVKKYITDTGEADDIEFRVHDFAYRGVSSEESAMIGSAANLLMFSGTDTIAGILGLKQYYNSDIFAKSVPATEHSVATLWGQDEIGYLDNCLNTYPSGIISVVCDSFNQFKFISNVISQRKEQILNRNGVLCVRLDSGDPQESIIRSLSLLNDIFPSTKNSKGYYTLPKQIRILQGDGINRFSIPQIYESMKMCQWSADNIYFGSGGGLIQKLDRDINKFAYKASQAVVDGVSIDIFKNPFGDPTKKSKKGRLKLVKAMNGYHTVSSDDREYNSCMDQMRTVFENGQLLIDEDFQTIRERIN